MSKNGSRIGFIAMFLVWCGWLAFSATGTASLDIQKQAKAAGCDVKTCQSCHIEKLPKKDSHDMNDAGKWLVAEKEKRGAKAVDGAWLKDYTGKK